MITGSFKTTQKGTELPLLFLKGKPYLQVAHRLVWFREEHPQGRITTSVIDRTSTSAVIKATIYVVGQRPNGEPYEMLLSTAHKSEKEENFGDFIEKAETGAIGRALAMAGFGTQFDPELDEGDRLADAPIQPATKSKGGAGATKQQEGTQASSKSPLPKAVHSEPKSETTQGRSTLNALIRQTGKVLADMKKFPLAETAALVKGFGVTKTEELTDEQAEQIYTTLKGKL